MTTPPALSDAEGWYRVELSYAVFGFHVAGGRVVEAAPIARWMVGKSLSEVERWIRKKRGTLSRTATA